MRGFVLVLLGIALCQAGTVRRDPVTGKWISVSDEELHDSRFRDPRADGGGGGGFFDFGFGGASDGPSHGPVAHSSDFPLFDSPPAKHTNVHVSSTPRKSGGKFTAEIPLESSLVQKRAAIQPQPVAVKSRDRPAHSSKYTVELPIQEAVQIQAHQQGKNVGSAPKTADVPHIHHAADEVVQLQTGAANALQTRVMGKLCRFQGIAPAVGCPAEASNGCVDRTPCERQCEQDGFFHWRCKGPQVFTPEEIAAMGVTAQPDVPSYDQKDEEDYIRLLSDRVRASLESNDYEGLARAIIDAQKALAAGHSSQATTELLQMALSAQSKRSHVHTK